MTFLAQTCFVPGLTYTFKSSVEQLGRRPGVHCCYTVVAALCLELSGFRILF